jgi:hypothetical protein
MLKIEIFTGIFFVASYRLEFRFSPYWKGKKCRLGALDNGVKK